MGIAVAEARAAASRGEVPVGAVIAKDRHLLSRSGNRMVELGDPTAHAEMLAIRAAAAELGSERLVGADLYVTLEPCAMCAAAISFARIRRLYFGSADPKAARSRMAGGSLPNPHVIMRRTCMGVSAKRNRQRC